MIKSKPLFIFVLALLTSSVCYGQKVVKGIVVDSASFVSLADVHISIKNSARGTFTDANGNFIIVASPDDTLEFSLIGFRGAQHQVSALSGESIIRLVEISRLLNPVIVNGNIELPEIEFEKKRIWQNNTYDPSTSPNGMVPTFGPGVSIPFSIFSKGESEKKRAEELREENIQASTYVRVVNDPEVRQALMKKYKLSEKGYYDILTKFNVRNNHIMYSVSEKELLTMLDNFFENNAPR